MIHADHVWLIEKGVGKGKLWVELGSGEGAFTLALREVVGHSAVIYSVDKDRRALETQEWRMNEMFPGSNTRYIQADFTKELDLPAGVDGILMANSLHFVSEQAKLLRELRSKVKPRGRLVVVEYDAAIGNEWVPYPVSFERLALLAVESGWGIPQKLATEPSSFLGEMYAAVMMREG